MSIILTEDHIPSNPIEKQRIKNNKGKIYKSINKNGEYYFTKIKYY